VSPRPRKVSDDEVFAAAHRAATRHAPGDLTLAAIAAEAGVTSAALAQRFGTKRAMLLAAATHAARSAGVVIRDLRRAHRSPMAALRAYARCLAGLAESPAALARNLAYLQIDLADPDFAVLLEQQARATRAGLRAVLADAVAAGELRRDTDVGRLARTVETALSGSLLTWACYRVGTAAHWIRSDLDAVVAPYRSGSRRLDPRPAGRRTGHRSAPR